MISQDFIRVQVDHESPSSKNAAGMSSACTIKRLPSSRCASAIKIVCPLELIVATQPQLQPALLRLSAIISQYFNVPLVLLGSSLADAARPASFRAAFAVMAVFARITRVASCAGAVFMNARRVSAHFACRCFRYASKSEGGYYGGDNRYCVHALSIECLGEVVFVVVLLRHLRSCLV